MKNALQVLLADATAKQHQASPGLVGLSQATDKVRHQIDQAVQARCHTMHPHRHGPHSPTGTGQAANPGVDVIRASDWHHNPDINGFKKIHRQINPFYPPHGA